MIDKIKEKRPGKKGLKERAASAPKQFLRRGLDDGTERLRGQLRDASQRGQRDDYGGDRIEDTAWTGTRWAGRGVEKLLKKKWGGRDQGPEAEPVPASDSPETELPLEGSAPADPPRQGKAEVRVRIKTREATAQRPEGPRRPSTEKSNPSSSVHSATEKASHIRTEPPRIKTREYFQQGVFSHGDVILPSAESPVSERPSRSKIQEIRQIFHRREPSIPNPHQEAATSQPEALKMPPLPERTAKGTGVSQQFPDIKAKGAYLHRQTAAPMELPSQERTQGGREFVQEQGRREAIRRTELRRFRLKNAPVLQADSEKSAIQTDAAEHSLRPPTAEIPSSSPPFQRQDVPNPTVPRAEKPATRATKKASSKEKKAVKASKAGIKSSCRTLSGSPPQTSEAFAAGKRRGKGAERSFHRPWRWKRSGADFAPTRAREAAKASVSAIKAAIAAAQELIAALAAGGWAVVAVVLVLCMVGLLIASPFGLFFADAEGTGSGIPQAVAQINGEFTARIEQTKEDTPYDILDLDNDAVAAVLDNWNNVLAVYAVRASADGGSPSGLDGLTEENLSLLREVFWDMNQISSFTETVPKGEDDKEIILHITAVVKTPQEMAEEYGFTDEQKELLEELLKPEYQELFQALIGSSQDLTLSVEQVQEIRNLQDVKCLTDFRRKTSYNQNATKS